jgi:hypothetical protein
MRVTGSPAFVAAARAAYLVARDAEDKTRRSFLPMKNNIGPDSSGMAFRIETATIQSVAGRLYDKSDCERIISPEGDLIEELLFYAAG